MAGLRRQDDAAFGCALIEQVADDPDSEVERAEAAPCDLEERATEPARQLHATVELRRRMRNDLDRAHRRERSRPVGRAGEPVLRHPEDHH
ncbi:hypothetical protein [Streptomyces sp. NPDC003393]